MKTFYSIHNFVHVEIDSDDPDLHEGYRHYLRHFEVSESRGENTYEIKEYTRFVMPETSIGKEGYVQFINGVCFPDEKYALTYDGKKITEYTTYPNRATNMWIELLLVAQNMSFIHSAGVAVNGKGIIFPAVGGVGKTTLMSHMRRQDNIAFFGDDFIILNHRGDMFSYPSDFSIYNYHRTVFLDLKNTSFEQALQIRKYFPWFFWLRRACNFALKRLQISAGPFLKGWNALYVKVPASFLIKRAALGHRATLSVSIFLERYSGDVIKSEKMSKEELGRMLTSILQTEFKYGLPYLQALAGAVEIDLPALYAKQEDSIKKALVDVACYKVLLPEKLEPSDYFDFMDSFIKSLDI